MSDRRLCNLLDSYEGYRSALLHFYRDLDISTTYAGDPRLLLAGLLVAEVVDGIALPPPSDFDFRRFATVFGPTGEDYQVFMVSDLNGVFGGGWFVHQRDLRSDYLAVVAFVAARPVAIHLIAAQSVDAVGDALSVPRVPRGGGLCMTMVTHSNLILEPVVAAAYGVKTVILGEGT